MQCTRFRASPAISGVAGVARPWRHDRSPGPVRGRTIRRSARTPRLTLTSCEDLSELSEGSSRPDAMEIAEWNDWLANELADQLVGISARSRRAEVKITAVQKASVTKGRIRANEFDLVLELEGSHLKQSSCKMLGSVRVMLKTEDHRDQITMSDAQWEDASDGYSQQVREDIMAAADCPLQSALSNQLNDVLWDVEKHSLNSMDRAASF